MDLSIIIYQVLSNKELILIGKTWQLRENKHSFLFCFFRRVSWKQLEWIKHHVYDIDLFLLKRVDWDIETSFSISFTWISFEDSFTFFFFRTWWIVCFYHYHIIDWSNVLLLCPQISLSLICLPLRFQPEYKKKTIPRILKKKKRKSLNVKRQSLKGFLHWVSIY